MDTDPEQASRAPAETAPPSRPRRGEGRASMRPEFLALFRDTRNRASPQADAQPATDEQDTDAGTGATSPQVPAQPEPSWYLRRFLRQTVPSPERAPSGLQALDTVLGGGFDSGLNLVLGGPGAGKRAFLESLLWEAVAVGRPVLYFAFVTGSLQVWEHLIVTLGTILDAPAIPRAALRSGELSPENLQALNRLDAVLQESVLPSLSLVDATPTSAGSLSTFLEDVRFRAQEVTERHGRLPLVLIDDLHRLQALAGYPPVPQLLRRLDEILLTDSLPGLLAAERDAFSAADIERMSGQTILTLSVADDIDASGADQVDLEVRRNATTGQTASLCLLLDRESGFFAECSRTG